MSVAVSTAPNMAGARFAPLRVMVVDDSAVIRGLIARWIDSETDLTVVATVRTGLDAVNQVTRVNPDVVILDIEMPDMDGITALPKLLEKKRDLVVIMASTLTRRNAEVSLKALSLGAADYIPKPESTREMSAADSFKRDLVEKIRHLGARLRRQAPVASPPLSPAVSPVRVPVPHAVPEVAPIAAPSRIRLRSFGVIPPRVLLIGSSTGGPQALMTVVGGIGSVIDQVPVLITQHMPPTFTTILAEHLARASKRPAHEAVNGEEIKPGHIYLAPGGHHMRVARSGSTPVIALDDGPQINFCKPAVDPLFSSAADVWQAAILAVVLTGMGSDGAKGGKTIADAGGSVIAQDEATSVVWGMPGAVANAGTCAAVLPLNEIAPKVIRIFAGVRG